MRFLPAQLPQGVLETPATGVFDLLAQGRIDQRLLAATPASLTWRRNQSITSLSRRMVMRIFPGSDGITEPRVPLLKSSLAFLLHLGTVCFHCGRPCVPG